MPRKKEVAPVIDKLQWIADQLRAAQLEDTRLTEIISKGVQYKTTATGYPALIFETCSCKSYADRRSAHSQECTVEAVTDPAPIVAAMREQRLCRAQVADLLRLRDEIQPEDQSAEQAEFLAYLQKVHDDNDAMKAEINRLKVQLARALSEPVVIVPG